MSKETRELRDKIRAENGGDILFAEVPRLGLIACKKADSDKFLEYLTAVWSPHESSGVAREQLVVDTIVYPKEPQQLEKVRRFLRAMPALALDLSRGIEDISAGKYNDFEPSDEERKNLDDKHEFGWACLEVPGFPNIVLATSETAGTVARTVIDAIQSGTLRDASSIRSAILAFVKNVDQDIIETMLDERPGLVVPLWVRCQELAGVGLAELGKG